MLQAAGALLSQVGAVITSTKARRRAGKEAPPARPVQVRRRRAELGDVAAVGGSVQAHDAGVKLASLVLDVLQGLQTLPRQVCFAVCLGLPLCCRLAGGLDAGHPKVGNPQLANAANCTGPQNSARAPGRHDPVFPERRLVTVRRLPSRTGMSLSAHVQQAPMFWRCACCHGKKRCFIACNSSLGYVHLLQTTLLTVYAALLQSTEQNRLQRLRPQHARVLTSESAHTRPSYCTQAAARGPPASTARPYSANQPLRAFLPIATSAEQAPSRQSMDGPSTAPASPPAAADTSAAHRTLAERPCDV